jgi:hypothetical protein
MWTLGAESIISLGERCKEGNPQTDESGRMLTPECFDLHPGKFHISLVNQIGIVKKAFVMDSFGNEPVWNFPVIGYSFIYFNPNKPDEGNNLQNSIIDIKNYSNDRFLNHRNPNAKYIVGVKAYVNSVPNITPWTTTSFEREKIFSYTYDLELDQNFNIIGGEWYSTNRPDFIWKTTKNFEPKTPIEDDMNAKWDPEKEYIPRDWLPHAKASSKHGVVLSPIVNQLFRLSSEGLNGYLTN